MRVRERIFALKAAVEGRQIAKKPKRERERAPKHVQHQQSADIQHAPLSRGSHGGYVHKKGAENMRVSCSGEDAAFSSRLSLMGVDH